MGEAGTRGAAEQVLNARVRRGALREAVRLKGNRIGTDHILLEILGNEEGVAVRMLARLGVSPETLEDRMFELRGRADG